MAIVAGLDLSSSSQDTILLYLFSWIHQICIVAFPFNPPIRSATCIDTHLYKHSNVANMYIHILYYVYIWQTFSRHGTIKEFLTNRVSSGQLASICCTGTVGSSSLASDFTDGNHTRSKCITTHTEWCMYHILPLNSCGLYNNHPQIIASGYTTSTVINDTIKYTLWLVSELSPT